MMMVEDHHRIATSQGEAEEGTGHAIERTDMAADTVEVAGVVIDTIAVPMTDIAARMIETIVMITRIGTQGLRNASELNMMTIMQQSHRRNPWVDLLLPLHMMSRKRGNYNVFFYSISIRTR